MLGVLIIVLAMPLIWTGETPSGDKAKVYSVGATDFKGDRLPAKGKRQQLMVRSAGKEGGGVSLLAEFFGMPSLPSSLLTALQPQLLASSSATAGKTPAVRAIAAWRIPTALGIACGSHHASAQSMSVRLILCLLTEWPSRVRRSRPSLHLPSGRRSAQPKHESRQQRGEHLRQMVRRLRELRLLRLQKPRLLCGAVDGQLQARLTVSASPTMPNGPTLT